MEFLRYVVVLALISILSLSANVTALTVMDVEKHQEVNTTPTATVDSVLSGTGSIIRCARVHVSGLSRLRLGSYSSTHRAAVVPSPNIQEKLFKRIQICLHNNASQGLCRCENDNWENIQNGMWGSNMSPYGDKYIDVKFVDNLSGFVTVSIKEEFQRWRVLCLFVGMVLLLLAPVVSGWVPFYYSSSMAIGICLVILIVLFQGMKLLPTGRKTALYSTMYGLAIGAGSLLLKRFSMLINSILVNFGISEEMHNPMLIFTVVLIVLAGAGFGYWLVRKFVVAEDGTVDVGIAQFVKWALRILGLTFIFQSTLDTPLAIAMLLCVLGIYKSFTYMRSFGGDYTYSGYERPWVWSSSTRVNDNNKKRTEFLSRSGALKSRGTTLWKKPVNSPAWSKSPPGKGILSPPSRRNPRSPPSSRKSTRTPNQYYSTFHKTPNRKKFTEEEWKEFTEQSTKQAVAELAASPEFTDWVIVNADRIRLHKEGSSDESIGSGSDSSEENISESSTGGGLRWRR